MAAQLKWVPTEYEAETERGTYHLTRYGSDWEAKFAPRALPEGMRRVSINAMDADGSPIDFPSLGTAQLAVQKHMELMADGVSPDVAAARVQVLADDYEREIERDTPEQEGPLHKAEGWR